jgi:hypothetical protein
VKYIKHPRSSPSFLLSFLSFLLSLSSLCKAIYMHIRREQLLGVVRLKTVPPWRALLRGVDGHITLFIKPLVQSHVSRGDKARI